MRLGTLLFRRRLSREPLRPRLSCRGLAFEALEDRRLMSVSTAANLLSGMAAPLATAADVASAQPFTALPQATSVTPLTGSTAGGTSVTLTGSGFTGATAVTFGTVAATSFTVVSDQELTAISPAQTPRIIDVLVTTPSGTSGNDPRDQFVYAPPITGPQVGSIAPPTGSVLGGTSVAISGINFTGATAVTFGSVPATSFNILSDTQVTATSPAAQAVGSVDVTVTGPNGTSSTSLADLFVYTDPPAPTVTAVSPARGSTAGGTSVTITGTGFDGATAVTFGSTPAMSFSVLSDSQITAISPPGTAGASNVTVATANGTSATGVADQFAYAAGSSASAVGVYTPGSGQFLLRNTDDAGAADTTVPFGPPVTGDMVTAIAGDWNGDGTATIGLYDHTNGTFYLKNSNAPNSTTIDEAVQFGPTSTGSTWIPVVGDWNNSGNAQVGLYNQTTATFELREVLGSSVTVVTFMYGPAGNDFLPIAGRWTSGATEDTIGLYDPDNALVFLRDSNTTGVADNAFVYGSPVYVGGSLAGQKIPWRPIAGDWTGAGTDTIGLYDPGTATFYLRNSNDGGFAQRTFVFGPVGSDTTPLAGAWNAPVLTAVAPNIGSTLGGTAVTITGNGLSDATAVTFGTVAAASFSVISDTQITATSPPSTAGAVDVTVTSQGGVSAVGTADPFTYTAAASLASVPDSQITALRRAGLAGTVDVSLTDSIGTPATDSADQFAYV